MKNRGISLIVLVITIIIIIILAGAVILSLSNSNVINKAKSGVMQTDSSTIKEQIRTKMAENELNSTDVKIGTNLWDSYYTMSVSQLQEIGISSKSDCIYDYNTGSLSVKQNNEYVTPEELYGRDSATNYIEGYVTYNFGTEEVTDAEISSETNATTKAALQKQQLAQKYTNGEIKVNIYDVDLSTLGDEFYTAVKNPKYTTTTTNNGYFLLNNITIETGKTYYMIISTFDNTIGLYKLINLNNYMNKMLFTKANPLKLYLGNVAEEDDYEVNGNDTEWFFLGENSSNLKKYDFSKNGTITIGVGTPDHNIIFGSFGHNSDDYTMNFN